MLLREINNKNAQLTDLLDYFNDVKNQYMAGYINGTSDTTFEPDRSITRAEVCAINNRLCKSVDENNTMVFKVINNLLERITVLEGIIGEMKR